MKIRSIIALTWGLLGIILCLLIGSWMSAIIGAIGVTALTAGIIWYFESGRLASQSPQLEAQIVAKEVAIQKFWQDNIRPFIPYIILGIMILVFLGGMLYLVWDLIPIIFSKIKWWYIALGLFILIAVGLGLTNRFGRSLFWIDLMLFWIPIGIPFILGLLLIYYGWSQYGSIASSTSGGFITAGTTLLLFALIFFYLLTKNRSDENGLDWSIAKFHKKMDPRSYFLVLFDKQEEQYFMSTSRSKPISADGEIGKSGNPIPWFVILPKLGFLAKESDFIGFYTHIWKIGGINPLGGSTEENPKILIDGYFIRGFIDLGDSNKAFAKGRKVELKITYEGRFHFRHLGDLQENLIDDENIIWNLFDDITERSIEGYTQKKVVTKLISEEGMTDIGVHIKKFTEDNLLALGKRGHEIGLSDAMSEVNISKIVGADEMSRNILNAGQILEDLKLQYKQSIQGATNEADAKKITDEAELHKFFKIVEFIDENISFETFKTFLADFISENNKIKGRKIDGVNAVIKIIGDNLPKFIETITKK